MKKFNSSRNIIIALIVVIIVVLLVTFSTLQRDEHKKSFPGQSQINSAISVVDRVVSAPFRGIENGVKSISNLFSTYDENKVLKSKIDQTEAIEAELDVVKEENANLKQQLELNSSLADFEQIHATVINRSPDTWQDQLIIDKGEKDGLEVNMAVMGDKGLIGRVIIVEKHSAKVELLTTLNQNTNYFPVMIETAETKDNFGLMEGYNNKTHTLVVSQLTTVEGIEKGDPVTTSGLGNNSPKGLLVGEVAEIKKSRTGLDDELLIKPIADMYDVTNVTVIKRLAGVSE